ncbi:MAG: GNAT family N-acetyltransferase [Lachnospiraceae bacterium]|nr:GNAT family N-acetyltransferase [Lachnospiraceae bacterium]
MLSLEVNTLDVDEYLELRSKVGWKKLSKDQAEKALENSLYIVTARLDGVLCGMGRIVGDGAVICYVQDLIVIPEAQGKKVGSAILSKLKDYVEGLRIEDTQMMFCLMCAKGRESFYKKHGFIARPTENLGPGMIMYLRG